MKPRAGAGAAGGTCCVLVLLVRLVLSSLVCHRVLLEFLGFLGGEGNFGMIGVTDCR